MPLDPGSVVLAAALATLGWSVAHQLLRHAGWGSVDVPMTLGARLADDPQIAFAAGLFLHLSFGVAWGFVYAVAWSLTGLPIAPFQGALFAIPHWVAAELTIGATSGHIDLEGRRAFRPRRSALGMLATHVAYGGLLGLLYRPGT